MTTKIIKQKKLIDIFFTEIAAQFYSNLFIKNFLVRLSK